MTWESAVNILFAAGVASICFIFYIVTGYMRLRCDEQVWGDPSFANDIRGTLAGVCRFSFWLGILALVKMFV